MAKMNLRKTGLKGVIGILLLKEGFVFCAVNGVERNHDIGERGRLFLMLIALKDAAYAVSKACIEIPNINWVPSWAP